MRHRGLGFGFGFRLNDGAYKAAQQAAAGGGGAPPVTPLYSPLDYASALIGWGGPRYIDSGFSPTRMMFKANPIRTMWAGFITDTGASMRAYGSTATDILSVSVDGGAWTPVSSVSNVCTLFSGLPMARHFVMVRWRPISDNRYWPTNLTDAITTATPGAAIEPVREWLQQADGSGKIYATGCTAAIGGSYVPALGGAASGNSTFGPNCTSVVFNTTATELVAAFAPSGGGGTNILVSVNGAAPTIYTVSDTADGNSLSGVLITLSAGNKVVRIWQGNGSGLLMVGRINGSFSASSVSRAIHQIGGSTTQGQSASMPGMVDTFIVARGIDRIATQFGVSGNTNAQILARLTGSILPNLVVGSGDVMVVDAGRNDGSSWSGAALQAYKDIISACLTKGYRGVICRNFWNSGYDNASVAAAVASFANPRVVLCDASGWTGIATSDGTHPTDAGYVTISNYCLAAYPPLIAGMP